MPDILKTILLGIVQGLTEFLPVSSSGHLVIAHDLFDFHAEGSLLLDVFLHVGTLVPIVIVFWRDLVSLLTTRRQWLWLLALGTVPVVVVGLLLHDSIEAMFETSRWVGVLLLINGAVLLGGSRLEVLRGKQAPGWLHAVTIGVAQAVAILPGISRSGSTISTGLATGLEREDAARFSFLLAIPAIGLALVYKLFKFFTGNESLDIGWGSIAAGTVTAMVVGYIALRVLLAVVRRHKLAYFGWYCAVVGTALVVSHLVR